MPEPVRSPGAVFLSYASQDSEAAARICEALRAAGVEVWFDKSELRGGDAWDLQIKKQIHDCALFVPIISAHTNARKEGYFRREWNLATRRLLDMANDAAFLVPVVVDETTEADARVPEEFLHAQWTRLPGGETPVAFTQRVRQLLGDDGGDAHPAHSAVSPRTGNAARVTYSRNRRALPIRLVAIAAVALLVLGAGAIWYYQVSRTQSATTQASSTASPTVAVAPNEKSIAVLPFADMSAEKNQEYMSDGIAEELLNLLAQVPDLKVIARTSSFAFKGQQLEVAEIAKRLNVSHVLEGSVRTSGKQMRITAQLVRAADSTHLWSDRYDRPMDDIFAVQDEIANAIVQALQIRLTGGELDRRKGGTENLEAYQLFLRSKGALNLSTRSSWGEAGDYLEQAIKLDPSYGLGWSQLAWVTLQETQNGWLDPTEGYERVRRLAQHALQLSPDLSEAHAALAYVHRTLDWNWAAAEKEVQRALAIDPANHYALDVAGTLYYTLGRWDDAVRNLRAALGRDPFNTIFLWDLAITYYLAGRFAEAEETLRKLLELAPHSAWAPSWLGKTLLAQGEPQEALAMLMQEVDEETRLGYLPIFLQAVGRRTESDEALQAQIVHWAATCAICVARTYAYRGDRDSAFEWLERAYQQKDTSLTQITGDPLLKNLESDPRYSAFLKKMNLPEPESVRRRQ